MEGAVVCREDAVLRFTSTSTGTLIQVTSLHIRGVVAQVLAESSSSQQLTTAKSAASDGPKEESKTRERGKEQKKAGKGNTAKKQKSKFGVQWSNHCTIDFQLQFPQIHNVTLLKVQDIWDNSSNLYVCYAMHCQFERSWFPIFIFANCT